MYSIGDLVVIVGCTIDGSKQRRKIQLTIAKILEIGRDDLIVKPMRSYGDRSMFISKNACKQIPLNDTDVENQLRKPQIGDLVLYYYQKWSEEVERCVGYILEIKYEPGHTPRALIMSDGENKWYDYSRLLVLDIEDLDNN